MSIGGGARFREDGRTPTQLRPVSVELDVQKWTSASVIIRVGGTHVLCAATIEDRIPPHLRGKGTGWITAEYSMLPGATSERSQRESAKGRIGGRTHEIQRLIGRSLRGVVNTAMLGERTVTIDCDVIQADGGTRCASITGGWIALSLALRRIGLERAVASQLAAVSVGIMDGVAILDLDYPEDSHAEVDCNVVATSAGTYVEIQGTAEGKPFSRTQLDELLTLADSGIAQLFEVQRQALAEFSGGGGPAPVTVRLLLATRSEHKLQELQTLLHLPWLELVTLDEAGVVGEAIEDAATFRGNAIIKARFYCGLSGMPTMADDSGVEVDALGGAPGVFTKRFAGPDATDEQNNLKLLSELGDLPMERRRARYRCVLAFLDPRSQPVGGRPWVMTRSGTLEGRIAFAPHGSGGFGYDPIFEPLSELGSGRTVGDYTADEKNQVSHRARAARAMARYLKKRYPNQ